MFHVKFSNLFRMFSLTASRPEEVSFINQQKCPVIAFPHVLTVSVEPLAGAVSWSRLAPERTETFPQLSLERCPVPDSERKRAASTPHPTLSPRQQCHLWQVGNPGSQAGEQSSSTLTVQNQLAARGALQQRTLEPDGDGAGIGHQDRSSGLPLWAFLHPSELPNLQLLERSGRCHRPHQPRSAGQHGLAALRQQSQSPPQPHRLHWAPATLRLPRVHHGHVQPVTGHGRRSGESERPHPAEELQQRGRPADVFVQQRSWRLSVPEPRTTTWQEPGLKVQSFPWCLRE